MTAHNQYFLDEVCEHTIGVSYVVVLVGDTKHGEDKQNCKLSYGYGTMGEGGYIG